MRKIIFLFLGIALACYNCFAQENTSSLRIRVQYKDTAVFCDCAQDDNSSDYGNVNECNSLGAVMINVYADSALVHTYYTDQTGYTPDMYMTKGKYTLVFHEKSSDSAVVAVDLTALDKRNYFTVLTGNAMHLSNYGRNYFMCLIMNKKGKHGVRIVPKQN